MAAAVPRITAEGAGEHVRRPRFASVERDAGPAIEVARAANGRAAAGFAIGVRWNEIPEVATDVAPPLVRELHMPVRVERHVGRETFGRPRLERVEVEECSPISLGRTVELQREPVAEHLLVRALLEADIIGLEAGG